ncbi:response regulator transcription factor [Mycoplana dimorpha]|uniref:response regulator transcription factor n=1 Tax=Mycoplana dimorpha TaxID=28320 RepID=UPI00315A09F6
MLLRDAPHNLSLSPRESGTLALLADGGSNKLIARQLKIAVHTAKFHVVTVLAKLHAQNRRLISFRLPQGPDGRPQLGEKSPNSSKAAKGSSLSTSWKVATMVRSLDHHLELRVASDERRGNRIKVRLPRLR